MISKEVIQKHKEEIEYKSIACETNINALKAMIKDAEKELKKADNENTKKTLSIQLDQLTEQLAVTEKALIQHNANITYLNNKLWV